MRKKSIIIGTALALCIAVGCAVYFSSLDKTASQPFYNESLLGIPHLEGQELVQDSMEEYGSGSTGGILSYKITDTNMTVEKAASFFIKNTDNTLWNVERQEPDDNSQVLVYNPVDTTKVKSTTQVLILQSDNGLVINVISYYEEGGES